MCTDRRDFVVASEYNMHTLLGDVMLTSTKSCRSRSRSQLKVMYQQQKRYNTAMDRFNDFKPGMAS